MPKKNPTRKRPVIEHGVIDEELSYNTGRHADQPIIIRLTRTLAPMYGRRTEQAYLDARNALCRLPEFKRHIVRLRKQVSQHSTTLNSQVREFCREWEITEGMDWVEWLLKNWDPTTQELPPAKESSAPPPRSLIPWTVKVTYLLEEMGGTENPVRATIVLNAGISTREAENAARLAAKKVSPRCRGGRPSLTDAEREQLRSQFSRLGVPRDFERQEMVRKVEKIMAKRGSKMSQSSIAKELRLWLVEKGEHIRQVLTDKRDVRKN